MGDIVYPLMPKWFLNLSNSQNSAVCLAGSIFQTGICEEICKILPVSGLMLILRKKLSYSDIVMIGVFSGLGFAAFENLLYFSTSANQVANAIMSTPVESIVNDPTGGSAGMLHASLVAESQGSMLLALSRIISCTFGHAVYCGIFAHFLAQGRGAGIKRVPLWIVGLAAAALFHGVYDWLLTIQTTLPVLSDVLAFMMLKVYVSRGYAASIENAVADERVEVNGNAVRGAAMEIVQPSPTEI